MCLHQREVNGDPARAVDEKNGKFHREHAARTVVSGERHPGDMAGCVRQPRPQPAAQRRGPSAHRPLLKPRLGVRAVHGWGRPLVGPEVLKRCHIHTPPSHPHNLVVTGI